MDQRGEFHPFVTIELSSVIEDAVHRCGELKAAVYSHAAEVYGSGIILEGPTTELCTRRVSMRAQPSKAWLSWKLTPHLDDGRSFRWNDRKPAKITLRSRGTVRWGGTPSCMEASHLMSPQAMTVGPCAVSGKGEREKYMAGER